MVRKKILGGLQYIHVVGAVGNAVNTGVCFFLPDPSCWPLQLGFHGLVLEEAGLSFKREGVSIVVSLLNQFANSDY